MPADLRHRRQQPASSTTTADTTSPTPSSDPAAKDSSPKIDKSGLYDLQQVKRLLDDQTISFMEDKGYDEAVLVSNIKIIFGTLAVIAALYSHFNPWEFPPNKTLVFSCVTFYFFCIGVINASSYIWEASAVFVGKLGPKVRQVGKAQSLAPNIWVITTLGGKGTSIFKVELRTAPRQKVGAVHVEHPYEKYFTEHGRFLVDVFRADMTTVLQMVDTGAKKSS